MQLKLVAAYLEVAVAATEGDGGRPRRCMKDDRICSGLRNNRACSHDSVTQKKKRSTVTRAFRLMSKTASGHHVARVARNKRQGIRRHARTHHTYTLTTSTTEHFCTTSIDNASLRVTCAAPLGECEGGRVYALSFLRALAEVFQHLERQKKKNLQQAWCHIPCDTFYAAQVFRTPPEKKHSATSVV